MLYPSIGFNEMYSADYSFAKKKWYKFLTQFNALNNYFCTLRRVVINMPSNRMTNEWTTKCDRNWLIKQPRLSVSLCSKLSMHPLAGIMCIRRTYYYGKLSASEGDERNTSDWFSFTHLLSPSLSLSLTRFLSLSLSWWQEIKSIYNLIIQSSLVWFDNQLLFSKRDNCYFEKWQMTNVTWFLFETIAVVCKRCTQLWINHYESPVFTLFSLHDRKFDYWFMRRYRY